MITHLQRKHPRCVVPARQHQCVHEFVECQLVASLQLSARPDDLLCPRVNFDELSGRVNIELISKLEHRVQGHNLGKTSDFTLLIGKA